MLLVHQFENNSMASEHNLVASIRPDLGAYPLFQLLPRQSLTLLRPLLSNRRPVLRFVEPVGAEVVVEGTEAVVTSSVIPKLFCSYALICTFLVRWASY